MQPKRLLVTGGAGFIGSNFVRYVLESHPQCRVVTVDALTYAGNPANLSGLPDDDRHTFVHGDILDQPRVEALLRAHEIDTIVHFAAESHVDRSILGPEAFVQTNVVGTFRLLEAARAVWLGRGGLGRRSARFHHVSTDEVYGSLADGDPPFSASSAYAPNSPYAASKAASDHLVRAYFHTYGLPVTISNCSNNYGPRQNPEKLIPLAILRGAACQPIPIYGDGLQVRDWLYIDDHCEALWAILSTGAPGRTYTVGGGNQPTNLALVQRICRLLDEFLPEAECLPHESLIEFVPDRPGHDRRYAMDIVAIDDKLGWRPRETLTSGLRRTVDWYLSNPEWTRTALSEPAFQQWVTQNYSQRGAEE